MSRISPPGKSLNFTVDSGLAYLGKNQTIERTETVFYSALRGRRRPQVTGCCITWIQVYESGEQFRGAAGRLLSGLGFLARAFDLAAALQWRRLQIYRGGKRFQLCFSTSSQSKIV